MRGSKVARRGVPIGGLCVFVAAFVAACVEGGAATPTASDLASSTVLASPSAVAIASSSLVADASGAISKEEAVAAAETFLGRKLANPTVEGPSSDTVGLYSIAEEGTGTIISVDPQTGRVVSMLVLTDPVSGVTITQAQAESTAEGFLVEHHVPFDGMTKTVEFMDHGAMQEYSVTWQRYVNGAAVPDSRVVRVDAHTCKVFSFNDLRLAYGPVASPAVGRDDAIALAIEKSGLTEPKVESVSLEVARAGEWAGRLVWSVGLSARMPELGYYAIYVDAITGETLIYGQG
jgi:hypothetical protein